MRFLGIFILLILSLVAAPAGARADDAPPAASLRPSATVELDGRVLFRVRGAAAYPADERAETIVARLHALAKDPTFRAESLQVTETAATSEIRVHGQPVVAFVDADGELDGVSRQELALAVAHRLAPAIEAYRDARLPSRLWRGAILSLVATVLLLAGLWLLLWVFRKALARIESRYKQRIRGVGIQTFSILRAEHLWMVVQGVATAARTLLVAVLIYVYLQFVLGRFPWTHQLADALLGFVLDPLRTMGSSFLVALPSLFFLLVLFFVVRWFLKLLRLFFETVGRGGVVISGFEAEWAEPTHRIVRVLVVAFALVVAFPYIPGSSSGAFKGISLFLGLMFSLGSSSVLSNLIAGFTMTYRRTFRPGDRVRINDIVGDVISTRLQVTHLRTPKNEEVIVPNSMILNSQVVNYTTFTRKEGIILHTTVGIGYETPWRQVEAMLKIAAERTPEVLAEPRPFVFVSTLGDFCVTYELNAYCADARIMPAAYAAMHRNILDVFNEHGVQIMTPAYEGDPEQPKLVPPGHWHEAPAPPAPAAPEGSTP